jgi:hypothetical protein
MKSRILIAERGKKMANWYAEFMGSVGEKLEFDYKRKESKALRKAKLEEADLVLDNAKARLAAGTREAGALRHRSKVIQSDAVAAMASQGGGVDVTDLARIKSRADFSAMNAMFDARMDYSDMRVRGFSMRRDAYTSSKFRAMAAELGAYGNLLARGSRAAGGSNPFGGGSGGATMPPGGITKASAAGGI